MAVKKLTRDELVTALRCCEDEDCMRCPVAYQPGSLCRGNLESQAADMLENHETERLALVKEIEKMRKQVEMVTAERSWISVKDRLPEPPEKEAQ